MLKFVANQVTLSVATGRGWSTAGHISNLIGIDLVDETDRYSTLAGYIFWQLGHLPKAGERVVAVNLAFEVVAMDGRNIDKVRITKTAGETAAGA